MISRRAVLLIFSYSSLARTYKIISIVGILTIYYIFLHPYVDSIRYITSLSTIRSNFVHPSPLNPIENVSLPSFAYSLDSECHTDLNDSLSTHRGKQFDHIFEKGLWNKVGSRSGGGSSLEGAYDWIRHLRTLFEHYSIRSVADIPCGDTWWQFSLREMNTLEELYFGGDISTSVIKQNQRLYGSKHRNKLFQYLDLVRCPVPTYTYKNSTHEIKGNRFDLVIVRDAIQHMHIRNGLKAVRNVINSGAKFFALSTYPPDGKSSAPITRSIGQNQSLPLMPTACESKNYCALGQITEGSFYVNNINCPPFSFPLNRAILVQPSHAKFNMESDEIHIYQIDDELKKIVEQYEKACA